MYGTIAQRHYGPRISGAPIGPKSYWGWSHSNQRMEFMDLPTYMESFRQGYDAAYGDLLTRMQQLGWPAGGIPGAYGSPAGGARGSVSAPNSPAPWGPGSGRDWHGHHGHRHHGHRWHEAHEGERHGCGCEHARDRDCGCRHDREHHGCEHDHEPGHCRCRSRCECCVVDADILVYGRCGEIRVVPIEIDNDSRKVRENVEVQVSEVRSGSGKVLAWPALIQPEGPLTLEPCRTTRLELLVHIACGGQRGEASQAASGGAEDASDNQDEAAGKDAPADAFAALAAQRDPGSDVDRCEVGYTTVRLEGCLLRPIVVAIAALPRECESYRVGCSCSCCC